MEQCIELETFAEGDGEIQRGARAMKAADPTDEDCSLLDALRSQIDECSFEVSRADALRLIRQHVEREVAAKDALIAKLREALARIERWRGEFPPSGRTWGDGSEMSYSAAFGSNGERDFMRGIARDALAATAESTGAAPLDPNHPHA